MPFYRDLEATGRLDEITVIEDPSMRKKDSSGEMLATFEWIDKFTIRAHPIIIDFLLQDAERLWKLEELLADL